MAYRTRHKVRTVVSLSFSISYTSSRYSISRWSETVGITAVGVWGSPQTVSGCAQGAAGTVAGKNLR